MSSVITKEDERVLDRLKPEVIENSQWDELGRIFKEMQVQGGPLVNLAAKVKSGVEVLRARQKSRKVLIAGGVVKLADDFDLNQVKFKESLGRAQVFIANMQAVRIVNQILPQKDSPAAKAATAREFLKGVDREEVPIHDKIRRWVETAVSAEVPPPEGVLVGVLARGL